MPPLIYTGLFSLWSQIQILLDRWVEHSDSFSALHMFT